MTEQPHGQAPEDDAADIDQDTIDKYALTTPDVVETDDLPVRDLEDDDNG